MVSDSMEQVVIKLGGSMISRGDDRLVEFEYLEKFGKLIQELGGENQRKFFLVAGGGHMMRRYRDEAQSAGLINEEQLHWIGTTVTVLNAEIVRAYFYQFADSGVYKYEDYFANKSLIIEKLIKVGAGSRPGVSSDMSALKAAVQMGTQKVISLKNVDGVYSADPKNNPSARRLERISWSEYFDIIGNPDTHEPGGNYPIDPVTAKEAEKLAVQFIIVPGSDLNNVRQTIVGGEFVGTVVG